MYGRRQLFLYNVCGDYAFLLGGMVTANPCIVATRLEESTAGGHFLFLERGCDMSNPVTVQKGEKDNAKQHPTPHCSHAPRKKTTRFRFLHRTIRHQIANASLEGRTNTAGSCGVTWAKPHSRLSVGKHKKFAQNSEFPSNRKTLQSQKGKRLIAERVEFLFIKSANTTLVLFCAFDKISPVTSMTHGNALHDLNKNTSQYLPNPRRDLFADLTPPIVDWQKSNARGEARAGSLFLCAKGLRHASSFCSSEKGGVP
jgi:hypothetical protein